MGRKWIGHRDDKILLDLNFIAIRFATILLGSGHIFWNETHGRPEWKITKNAVVELRL